MTIFEGLSKMMSFENLSKIFKSLWKQIWSFLKELMTCFGMFSWFYDSEKRELNVTIRVGVLFIVGFVCGCSYMWYRYLNTPVKAEEKSGIIYPHLMQGDNVFKNNIVTSQGSTDY